MLTWRRALSVGVLASLIAATGCQNPKESQILGLQGQIEELERQNADLQSQLQYAYNERDAARSRVNELQGLLDECRRRLTDRPVTAAPSIPTNYTPPTPTGEDGTWLERGNVAMLTLNQDILFDSGRASLKSGAMGTIRQVISDLESRYPGRIVMVVGHTDTDPIKKTKNLWEDNLDLSLNRAAAVVREMYKSSIPKDKIMAAGQGEFNPRADGSARDAKARNRRVEIIAVAAS